VPRVLRTSRPCSASTPPGKRPHAGFDSQCDPERAFSPEVAFRLGFRGNPHIEWLLQLELSMSSSQPLCRVATAWSQTVGVERHLGNLRSASPRPSYTGSGWIRVLGPRKLCKSQNRASAAMVCPLSAAKSKLDVFADALRRGKTPPWSSSGPAGYTKAFRPRPINPGGQANSPCGTFSQRARKPPLERGACLPQNFLQNVPVNGFSPSKDRSWSMILSSAGLRSSERALPPSI